MSAAAVRGAAGPHPHALAAWIAATLVALLAGIDPVLRALVVLVAVNVLLGVGRPGWSARPLLVAAAVAAVMSTVLDVLLSHSGDHTVAVLPGWLPGIGGALTLEAAAFGVATGLALAGSILAVGTLSAALDPHELLGALPRGLERVAVASAAALAMVPALARSWTAVSEAQRCRGWRPHGVRAARDVVVPVALTALEDSLQLAEALEARGYGGGRRTRFAAPGLGGGDRAVVVASAGAVLAVVAARAAGAADWYPFPDVTAPAVTWPSLAAAALLATPVLAWRSRRSAA